MDMAHLRRGNGRTAVRQAPRLDYRILVATLQAWQLSTPTARAGGRCGGRQEEADPKQPAPLARILLGGKDWQQAVLAQGGSFNPVFARSRAPRQPI